MLSVQLTRAKVRQCRQTSSLWCWASRESLLCRQDCCRHRANCEPTEWRTCRTSWCALHAGWPGSTENPAASHTQWPILYPPPRVASARADWAAWHLPGGPAGPPSRWATTSNDEVGQTTYPVNTGRVGVEGREGSEGQSHKEEDMEGGSETGECPRGR